MDRCSQEPNFLPDQLQLLIGKHVDIPEEIAIPPLKEVEFVFVAPFDNPVGLHKQDTFNVTFRRFKNQ